MRDLATRVLVFLLVFVFLMFLVGPHLLMLLLLVAAVLAVASR